MVVHRPPRLLPYCLHRASALNPGKYRNPRFFQKVCGASYGLQGPCGPLCDHAGPRAFLRRFFAKFTAAFYVDEVVEKRLIKNLEADGNSSPALGKRLF